MIIVFADGASSGNPGPGGWGAVILDESQQVQELGGASPNTTNNKMELQATLAALLCIREHQLPGSPISIFTDSKYVIQGITQWVHGWKRNGWKTAEGKDVSNRDLWEALAGAAEALRSRKLSWNYVPGHAGIPGNDRVDEIAVQFSKKFQPTLYRGPLASYGVDLSDITPKADILAAKNDKKRSVRVSGPTCYLSLVKGTVSRHSTWAECEARVKGVSGARFKKITSPDEEREVLKSWNVKPD
jgi:ribonuclease HI